MALMGIEEARAAMLGAVAPLEAETVTLGEACGRVLAADVIARTDQPPFDASAMDGWAVRAEDGTTARTIIGESAAGRPFAGRVGPGQTVRIFTGAAMPDGTDHVVLQEDARRHGSTLAFDALGKGHVRPRGLDHVGGKAVLTRGQRLGGARLALVAAAGVDPVHVIKAPRIALIATGDELTAPAGVPGPGGIFESVSHGLAGLVTAWGGTPVRIAATSDTPAAISAAIVEAQATSDLVVIIGGASVGDHDHARGAAGGRLVVEKVAVRPGKPTWFALNDAGSVLGLPGNPASALVCARLFLLPLIEAMAGVAKSERAGPVAARLGHGLPANGPRAHVRRAIVEPDANGTLIATSLFDQDSSLLSPFATANALIVQAPDTQGMAAGATVAAHWMTPP